MSGPAPHPRTAPRRAGRECASCRSCPVTCDRVVYPAGCVDADCSKLYSEERDGRVVMGCTAGVYRAEIDVELFELAQRSRLGFGALLVERDPLAICRTSVDEAFPHRAEEPCRNPDFLLDEMRRKVLNLDASEAGATSG